ncbi:C2H2 and C2HC zinc fingers superfamily protein [Trifolium repens]|nr:C2H2 and C2HC zinc fingers superfamily protein [Trifolium repens]
MPIRKYYFEYCEKQFQDTPSDRKRHNAGIQHQQANRTNNTTTLIHHHLINNPSASTSSTRDFVVTPILANIFIPIPTTIYSSSNHNQ